MLLCIKVIKAVSCTEPLRENIDFLTIIGLIIVSLITKMNIKLV